MRMTVRLRTLQSPRTMAFVLAVAACGQAPNRESHPRGGESSLTQFARVLRDGHSLYGLGPGCGEWHVQPGEADLDLTIDADDDSDEKDAGEVGQVASDGHAEAAEGRKESAPLSGHLSAAPDMEGRIYGFTYSLYPDRTPARMRISGRGGWTPAPDVVIRDPEDPDIGVIGVGSYCTTEVDVRTDPQLGDAVLVGDEIWYLTRDDCLRSPRSGTERPRGCSATNPPKQPSR